MDVFCGIDFGTTNTVVSICSRKGILIDSFSIPTILFIPFENQGISKVYIGDRAYKEYEKKRNGRYIHSIKRSLSDKYFSHTVINRTFVKLEELITLFLAELKKMIFEKWCIVPENIVLGRPVRFSLDKEADNLANKRLLEGFSNAGFKSIIQLEEPVAASLCFEDSLEEKDRKFLIIDLGGGTSDFSLVSRNTNETGIGKYKIESIDGINIGGDNFDEELMFDRISPLLGIDSTFESFDKRLPMPVHIYKDLSRWNNLHIYDKKTINSDFSDYLYKSDDPVAVHRLRAVIENKLTHSLLETTRKSKHELDGISEPRIVYNEFELGVNISFTDKDFSRIITDKTNSIISIMNNTVGGEENYCDIDKIILTGGSSRVKHISDTVSAITKKKDILLDRNFYDSVSKGLALYAYYKNLKIQGSITE